MTLTSPRRWAAPACLMRRWRRQWVPTRARPRARRGRWHRSPGESQPADRAEPGTDRHVWRIAVAEHPQRREYAGLVFAPGRDVPGYFNLWRGFAVEPRPGDCSKFLAHLRARLAGAGGVRRAALRRARHRRGPHAGHRVSCRDRRGDGQRRARGATAFSRELREPYLATTWSPSGSLTH